MTWNEAPRRLLQQKTGDGSRTYLRELLQAAVREDQPPSGLEERMERALGPLLEGAPGATIAAPTDAPAARSLLTLGGSGKWLGAVLIAAAIGFSVHWAGEHRGAAPARSVAANQGVPAPAAPGEPRPEVSEQPAPEPTPRVAPKSSESAAPSRALGHLGINEEMALLRRAHDALRAGAAAQAWSLTEEHRRQFPRGSLDQEREVIAIEALVALGRRSSAEERAARFRARYPGSSHQQRIDELLAERAR